MTSQLINNQDFKWDGFVGVKRVSLTFWFVRLLIDNFRKNNVLCVAKWMTRLSLNQNRPFQASTFLLLFALIVIIVA